VKEQVALATKESWKTDQMRLIVPKNNQVLKDDEPLAKHTENDSELHVVFQISENEWESVDVESTLVAAS